MTHNASAMMSDLTQFQIESLNEHEYSLFLAYGDTFLDQQTISARKGSDLVWEREATRLIEEAGGEKLRIG
jgi:hypothetical protein